MRFRILALSCFILLSAGSIWPAFDYENQPTETPLPADEIPPLGDVPAAQDTLQPLEASPQLPALGPIEEPSAMAQEEDLSLDDEGLLRLISPTGYLDYDEENNLIYSRDRSRVEYQGIVLEADRMIFDMNLQEVQAEGNVILTLDEQRIETQTLRFNFKDRSGAALNAGGKMGVFAFRIEDKNGIPSFQQINSDVTLIRDISLTTDDFPIPMYDIQAKEAIILSNERVLLRSATLRVRNVPVFYLPYYSRSLRGAFPWYFKFGTGDRTGVYGRIGYSYYHQRLEPSPTDDDEMIIASRGHLDVHADYLEKRGPGAGADYSYERDDGQDRGRIELYALSDSERELEDEEDDPLRWQASLKHRSQMSRSIYMQLNADAVSDPEVYYDILDNFGEFERGRIPERSARAALTMNREQFIGRIRVEVKERIGRNRFTDFSDPNSDNRDFDVQPGDRDKDDEGISKDRWGLVGAKAPEINLLTNYMRIAQSNFYYRAQLNLFNSLDRGLNIVESDDFFADEIDAGFPYDGEDYDTFVQGADFYQNLMHVNRINERVTWINKVGGGIGMAQRLDDGVDMVDGSNGFAPEGQLNNPGTGPASGYYDGVYFTDPRTFHAGWSDELFSYDDISDGFGYADLESRLNARFTDALDGYARYSVRGTSEDYIGDWYASLGDQSIRSDLYDFPLRNHWIDAGLNYNLLYPDMTLYTSGGRNLTGESELWPNEILWYYTPIGTSYRSPEKTVTANAAVTFLEQQYYHVDDPRAFTSQQLRWGGNVRYRDPSEMWWVGLAAAWRSNMDEALNDDDDTSLFEEGDDRFELSPSFGTRIGPKWTVVGATTYDSRLSTFEGARFHFNRDLHDALLSFRLRLREEVFNPQDREDEGQGDLLNNMDFGVSIQPKLPQQQAPLGTPQRTTLDHRFRSTKLELEG